MTLAIAFAAAALLLLWMQWSRFAYGVMDPIVWGNIGICFSAALLGALRQTGLIDTKVPVIFFLVLSAYVAGSLCAGGKLKVRSAEVRSGICRVVDSGRKYDLQTIVTLAILLSGVLGGLGLIWGAGGDSRAEFARMLRPLVIVQGGCFYLALLCLLSQRFSSAERYVLLAVLMVPTFFFSGKSFILPLVYFVGLNIYIRDIRYSPGQILILLALVGLSFASVVFLSYGARSLTDVAAVFLTRMWLSGDVYIYAYQMDGISWLRGDYDVNFIAYMLHPFTALLGVRAYDVPLGAELSSVLAGEKVFTGPNPQLPFLLDFFFNANFFLIGIFAFMFGAIVFYARAAVTRWTRAKSWWVQILSVTGFVFLPSAGFVDFSLVEMAFISMVVAGIFCWISSRTRHCLPEPE